MKQSRIVAFFIFLFFKGWVNTWRKTVVEHPEMKSALARAEPLVLAFWHGDELVVLSVHNLYRVSVMASMSKDGELMARVLGYLGVATSRGSSSRGGASGLKGLLRLSKEGINPSIPVDGPRGPYHVPKPGVFELSRVLGAKIVPCGVAAKSALVFKRSWNKAHFPWPFTRVFVVWGKPLDPVTQDQDPRSEDLANSLRNALDAAGQEAAKLIARL